jgi:hypothetical protein
MLDGVEGKYEGWKGVFTLVCGGWDAFEYGGPVGQFLIVDGTEMEQCITWVFLVGSQFVE